MGGKGRFFLCGSTGRAQSWWKGVEKFGLRIIYSSRERFKVG